MNRRGFNRFFLGSCLNFALFGTSALFSSSGCASRSRLITNRTETKVLADLHVHAMINKWNRNTPLGIRYPALAHLVEKFINATGMDWKDCHKAGVDLLCVTHFNVFDEWLSMPTDPNPDATKNTFLMMDQLEKHLRNDAKPFARLARNHLELKEILDIPKTSPEYRIAVIHSIEGGHALGGSLVPLELLAKRGLAILTLTHFFNKGIATAANAFPFFSDANSPWPNQGLSEFGRDVIVETERLGIIVDLIHATSKSVEDMFKVIKKPPMASHTSVRTLGDHPYSLFDEHIIEIAHRDGLIGVILDPFLLSNYSTLGEATDKGNLMDVVRTIRHIVKICGTHKVVGIGSDFAGFITGPKELTRLHQIGKLKHLLENEFGDIEIVHDILANNAIDFIHKNWRSGL